MAEADPGLFASLAPIPEAKIAGPEALDARLREAETPFLIRGLVAGWPLVQAGRQSADAARGYLLDHARDRPFIVSIGERGAKGRLFYDDAMGMNFATAKASLPEIFARIAAEEQDPDGAAVYLASIDLHEFFSGLHEANQVDLGDRSALASIWIGTRTRIAAHNDFPDNLACVAAGRRRFTLFPPGQFRNLYLGPIDNTPAGRAVSMVDFHAPDFSAHPRFREALRHAMAAELGPGDAIFIPSLWWHHVEALDPFNILVNYWWRDTPCWLGQPQDALNHALLAIRDLPAHEKRHWREMFDHYVFDNDEAKIAHIPAKARSVLAPLTAETAGRIRAFLLRALSR